MEMAGNPIQWDLKLLSECALRCKAFAKVLRYKEAQFHQSPNPEILGTLITLNNKLHQPLAAYGAIRCSMNSKKIGFEVKEKWFEKLGNWESAYIAHKLKYDQDRRNYDAIVG